VIDFLIYPTEACNLKCSYCDPPGFSLRHVGHVTYNFDILKRFISRFDDVGVQLYGGEPLLNMSFVEKVIKELAYKSLSIQTNGLLIGKVKKELFERIDAIVISLDGPEDITDRFRGKGTYHQGVKAAFDLRERGYRGIIGVRMTISPGVDIYRAVNHFLGECAFEFDAVYWQLNVLFHKKDWLKKEFINEMEVVP